MSANALLSAPPAAEVLDETERAALGRRWFAAMLRGDFAAAWRETDRLEIPRRRSGVREPWHLVWDGTPLAGRRVLIRCEHGLGDTLQFLRYCPLLEALGSHVIVKAQPMLLALLQDLPGMHELVNAWTTDPDPPHDVAIECMELAYAFRHTAAELPATVPYLATAHLRPPRISGGERKIGLLWASSAWNPARSLPLAALSPLAALPGVRLFNLQQGPERTEAATVTFPLEELPEETATVEKAAAAMLAFDAIVCVDTMAAHLAGALGRPVHLLLTHEADWRWMQSRRDSPWYPTMRIYRQPRPGAWAAAVHELVEVLGREESTNGTNGHE